MKSRVEKLVVAIEAHQLDACLITSAATLRYFSDYYFYFEYGASPFQVLPAVLFVDKSLQGTLLLADNETPPATAAAKNLSIRTYSSYVYETPLDFNRDFLNQLKSLFGEMNFQTSRIGIEKNSLPFVITELLIYLHPSIEFIDLSPEIDRLRILKDDDEIEQIRAACRLCDIGQTAAMKYARPGITELELFTMMRAEMDNAVGLRVPLMADLVSGSRSASGGGMPTDKVISEGDLILSDLTPCLNGYWGDSCNSFVVGEMSRGQSRTFALVLEALDIGIGAIRPGVKASTIDGLMRKHIGNYPHHSGHGVGLHYHEEPRIVPYNHLELKKNMVIALEPAIYEKDYGIRLEHLVVVTDDGCELLTQFTFF